MAAYLYSRPISGSSNWNAAGNPLVYKILRYDINWEQINDNGGFIQLQDTGVNNASLFAVGDYIRVTHDNGYFYGTVTASTFSGGNTLITLDTVYSAISGEGTAINTAIRTDYKIQVEPFYSSDDTSITGGIKLEFTAGADGIHYCDVASSLKPYLSAEFSNPSGVNETDADVSVKFYIKYQEYYDGGLISSPTDDVSNPIQAVFGVMQIGSTYGGNLREYYPDGATKKWLTKFHLNDTLSKLKAWRDWPFTISFIWHSTADYLYRKTREYDASGSLLATTYTALTDYSDTVNRIKLPTLNASTKTISLDIYGVLAADILSGSGSALTGNQTYTVALGATYAAGDYYFRLTATSQFSPPPGSSSVTIQIQLRNSGSGATQTITSAGGTTTFTSIIYGPTLVTATIAFDQYRVLYTTGAPQQYGITYSLYKPFASVINDITITVEDPCGYDADYILLPEKNPIHLFWKNSLGGDSHWNFDKYHEYTYTYSNGKKAKRVTLFATQLHPVQWEALNELNTLGEVYSVPISELTSSINKTSQRIGQQVYMLSQDGNTKTGVIVIPGTDKQLARDITHTIAIEIELPEILSV